MNKGLLKGCPKYGLNITWKKRMMGIVDLHGMEKGCEDTGADPGFPEGGGQDIHKHPPPPWTLSA